jgi:hypothetical protein
MGEGEWIDAFVANQLITCGTRKPDTLLAEQDGELENSAEILFAGALVLAFAGAEVLERLISDCETFEMDDADEFIAVLPDLALLKFHRHSSLGREKSVSPGV